MKYSIVCTFCNNLEKNSIISCSICSNSLEIKYLDDYSHNKTTNLALYRKFVPYNEAVSKMFPNSSTPIIKIGKGNIFAKLEYCSLSSSSKDREAFVEVNIARLLGYKGIVAASTGNMGGALASICAMLKFPCHIFIPEDTSENKIKQIEQFGAVVSKVSGVYDDLVPYAKEYAFNNKLFLASLQAFRFEGYKTIAYEIFEKFGKNLPKNIIIPLGDGTTYVGVWKGFQDLKSLGLIRKCPSLIGVQSNRCAPIANAYKNKAIIRVVKNPKTIAKAIRIGNPLDGGYALRIAKETKGMILSYSENQIIEAQKQLLREGVNAEYTSALAYCPVLANNLDDCLILITGSGFKN
jgi:threonine synthase